MSPDAVPPANWRRPSGAQLVCAWLHLTPRECYTLARASSDAALEMAVGYGLDRPVARRMSESEYWYLFDVHGAYGKTHGD